MSDPYRCQWCGQAFVVPSLVLHHMTTCPMRPEAK